ncbi:hypothetical protein CMI37_04940 [Candidatus Pacearchaeota archaeon]|nr:hypothetical protein [Candidatus Pacearchaeota archaeon]|tara:strand:+ start:2178 stop:2405 length:228 start_codon:yes stop_codon:yes gene_type:complete
MSDEILDEQVRILAELTVNDMTTSVLRAFAIDFMADVYKRKPLIFQRDWEEYKDQVQKYFVKSEDNLINFPKKEL